MLVRRSSNGSNDWLGGIHRDRPRILSGWVAPLFEEEAAEKHERSIRGDFCGLQQADGRIQKVESVLCNRCIGSVVDMAGGCGVGAFCSFCGKCGRVFNTTVSGIEVPQVAPPGVSAGDPVENAIEGDSLGNLEEAESEGEIASDPSISTIDPKNQTSSLLDE